MPCILPGQPAYFLCVITVYDGHIVVVNRLAIGFELDAHQNTGLALCLPMMGHIDRPPDAR